MVVTRDHGERKKGGLLANGNGIPVLQDEKVLEIASPIVYM